MCFLDVWSTSVTISVATGIFIRMPSQQIERVFARKARKLKAAIAVYCCTSAVVGRTVIVIVQPTSCTEKNGVVLCNCIGSKQGTICPNCQAPQKINSRTCRHRLLHWASDHAEMQSEASVLHKWHIDETSSVAARHVTCMRTKALALHAFIPRPTTWRKYLIDRSNSAF